MTTTAVVTAKCVQCGEKKDFGPNDVAPGDHPMCPKCFMPMVPVKAESKKE